MTAGYLKGRDVMSERGIVCQGCGSEGLERLLDLGCQPLCNEFLPAGDPPKPQTYYPLCICVCHECSLAQLDYVIPTEVSFGDQYTYLTGSSESLIRYYSELARRVKEKFDLRPGDTVIEIGSNDGTFLKEFQSLRPVLRLVHLVSRRGQRHLNQLPPGRRSINNQYCLSHICRDSRVS